MVHQRHLDKPCFEVARSKTPHMTEKHRTYIPRLCSAIGLLEEGWSIDLPITGNINGQTITLTRMSDHVLQIDMNDYFEVRDIDLYDQIIFRFEVEQDRVSRVSLFVIDAFDKGINRELEEFFEFADETSGFDWLKLEFLLDYLLRASRSLARREADMGCATLDIGAPDCREQSIYIQWEWQSERTVQIEVIGPRFAKPSLTPSQIKKLVEFGWALPEEGGIPNFHMTFSDTAPRKIAAFFVKSLQECYDIRPTDPIYVDPPEVIELLAPRENTSKYLEKYRKHGINVAQDVRVTEKWLRESPHQT